MGKIFNEAKKSSDDYHQYAQQLGMIFRNQTQVLEQIINLLFISQKRMERSVDQKFSLLRVVLNILDYKEISMKAYNLCGWINKLIHIKF